MKESTYAKNNLLFHKPNSFASMSQKTEFFFIEGRDMYKDFIVIIVSKLQFW